ncbi:MAG: hypothetical protein AAF211_24720 [Myxococcota bacterium]
MSLIDLWKAIAEAGGVDRYVEQQLVERGFLVTRRDPAGLKKAELERYKRELKREAAERRVTRKPRSTSCCST